MDILQNIAPEDRAEVHNQMNVYGATNELVQDAVNVFGPDIVDASAPPPGMDEEEWKIFQDNLAMRNEAYNNLTKATGNYSNADHLIQHGIHPDIAYGEERPGEVGQGPDAARGKQTLDSLSPLQRKMADKYLDDLAGIRNRINDLEGAGHTNLSNWELQDLYPRNDHIIDQLNQLVGEEYVDDVIASHPGASAAHGYDVPFEEPRTTFRPAPELSEEEQWLQRQEREFTPYAKEVPTGETGVLGEPMYRTERGYKPNITINPRGAEELKNLIDVPDVLNMSTTPGPATEHPLWPEIQRAMREGRPTIRLGNKTFFIHEHPGGYELTTNTEPPQTITDKPEGRFTLKSRGISFPNIYPPGSQGEDLIHLPEGWEEENKPYR
jgi:hypothetical protein